MNEIHTGRINNTDLPKISIKECLLEGWVMFKKYWWLLLAADIILLIFHAFTGTNKYLNALTGLLVLPGLYAGYYFLILNIGRDSNPSIKDFLKGFSRYWLSIKFFLFIGIMSLILIYPALILVSLNNDLNFFQLQPAYILDKMIFVIIAYSIIILLVFIRFLFSFLILVDNPEREVIAIFKESSNLLKGYTFNFLKLFSIYIFVLLSGILSSITTAIVIDLGKLSTTINSIPFSTVLISIIYYVCVKFALYSVIYLSCVRFYIKLKDIKRPEEIIVENDVM